ncbi:MAG TPA: hypothetical protein VN088_03700 [Nocardioides sp.]|nr:hypothetical protein [Nocardioides sp.]
MTLMRSALALGAAALMTASLAGCGGSDGAAGAPTDASKTDFCNAWKSLGTAVTGGNDESTFTALQSAVRNLEHVGTPSDTPTDARAGFEVAVDAILKASWNDVKGSFGSGTFPGVSADDQAKAKAFGTWAVAECPA